ncbi:DNA-binding domain-containing protein [Donghicola mangrovi]|uniref:DUF2063 domain-containing protein n=1 Tax=Donghicola mangrovi TaxID=2729614 RepID=A0A850QEN1_9RHOB|nr:DNA-binding domain-containing protein [Donghicola mangrovi]NVO24311.1 DUF2063 domain-containing protein [Donghicola mangrovi]
MTQGTFIQAVLIPDLPPPPQIRVTEAATRFNVYRNNVVVSLTEALQAAFPAIAQLVGPEFFAAMGGEFVRAHPPQTPVMAFYGAAFPNWLRGFAPVAALPYLPEVAAIEQARREAYHAADAPPLTGEQLARLAPDALVTLCVQPHPAARALRTVQPALAVWAQCIGVPDLARETPPEVLITRPAMAVQVHPAPAGTASTLFALANGVPLGEALGDVNPAHILTCLLGAGALANPKVFPCPT